MSVKNALYQYAQHYVLKTFSGKALLYKNNDTINKYTTSTAYNTRNISKLNKLVSFCLSYSVNVRIILYMVKIVRQMK